MKLGLKRNEVKLIPYTEEWHKYFLKVKSDLQKHTNLEEKQIEHIGSTAIKNIYAKPILDIVVGVDDISSIDHHLMNGLKMVGFLRLRVERPNEIVFAKFIDDTYEEKTHYIHLVNYNGELWNNLIFFRDYLNANEKARNRYNQLKLDFINRRSGGIKEYTDYKEQFVQEIYDKRKNN